MLLYEILNWWQMQAASFSVMGVELVKGKYRCFTLLLSILFVALHLPAFAAALELESSCTCSTPQIFDLAY